ncbi:MAG: IS1182 family transposase [Pyrinomonadaceae bacterium]|nr:IS1182 family transposase [Phycisphaerales bacterium]
MAGFRKPDVAREQLVLWTHRLDDSLPADHSARLVDELFGSSAFKPLFADWARQYHLLEGQPPYHPRDLAMLYCYCMLNRIRSSRQMECACSNRLDVIWLMSGQKPDHSTISAFVRANHKRVKDLFGQVVRVGIEAGLITLRHEAVDGTNIEASAGRGLVYKESTILKQDQDIEKEIAQLEKEYQDNERREGLLCVTDAADVPEDERLRRLREKRGRLRQALGAIQRRRDEKSREDVPDPKPIASTTDPDSRVMKDKEGRSKPNYNAQVVVDAGEGGALMIVAADVNDAANDSGQLMEMIAQTQETCGKLPEEFSADAGYNTGRELADLEEQKIRAYVADKSDGIRTKENQDAVRAVREGRTLSLPQIEALPIDPHTKLLHRSCFAYNQQADIYRCPAGQTLTLFRMGKRYDREGGLERKRYKTAACGTCQLASRCCKNPIKGREINQTEFEGVKQRMRDRMKSDEGRARYGLRGQGVEPRIGVLKSVMGVRKFLRRGLASVKSEWLWACLSLNIGILLRHPDRIRSVMQ